MSIKFEHKVIKDLGVVEVTGTVTLATLASHTQRNYRARDARKYLDEKGVKVLSSSPDDKKMISNSNPEETSITWVFTLQPESAWKKLRRPKRKASAKPRVTTKKAPVQKKPTAAPNPTATPSIPLEVEE